ncbi:GTPase IMAP family member 9-like [Fundulus heteroclitus]|uniref:GTPase IMAP family member 9-like n=1 Tax=Fundulus heteroclitus TaxID=8078 RepID=UPI00165B249A|nr:GTPase IMAP family member 9-like [Fundulus heteroclitus]
MLYLPSETNDSEIRIVVIGKTGAGKSASGNTILGRKAFESKTSAKSLTSKCQRETAEFDGHTLSVVDTPGLFDTRTPTDQLKTEIARCISLSCPGPHVFLIVIQLNRFTEEEQKSVEIISKMFGEQAARYTMALFTHGDDLEADGISIDSILAQSSDLCTFINQCGGGYHVLNNREQDPSQVRELLKKINSMVQRNGGSFYTDEKFTKAGNAIKEEVIRLLREDPDIALEIASRRAAIRCHMHACHSPLYLILALPMEEDKVPNTES